MKDRQLQSSRLLQLLKTAPLLLRSTKGLNGKKSEKQNRVTKSAGSGKRAAAKHNLPIKSAGCNKHLKQC